MPDGVLQWYDTRRGEPATRFCLEHQGAPEITPGLEP